jgi:hypothetical protein
VPLHATADPRRELDSSDILIGTRVTCVEFTDGRDASPRWATHALRQGEN